MESENNNSHGVWQGNIFQGDGILQGVMIKMEVFLYPFGSLL
jgi:hypothetical protein